MYGRKIIVRKKIVTKNVQPLTLTYTRFNVLAIDEDCNTGEKTFTFTQLFDVNDEWDFKGMDGEIEMCLKAFGKDPKNPREGRCIKCNFLDDLTDGLCWNCLKTTLK